MLLLHTLTRQGNRVVSSVKLPSSLGDIMVDRWTDGQRDRKIILLLDTLTIRGNNVASLVKFCPVVLGGDRGKDRQTDGSRCLQYPHCFFFLKHMDKKVHIS